MFRRAAALIGYCISLIFVVLSPSLFAQSNRDNRSSPGDVNPAAAQAEANVITVWRVGSLWDGGTPDTAVPPRLDLAARHLGYTIKIEAFPARSLASALFRAFEANRPPDVLAFDNICILYGCGTLHGEVQGIGSDPDVNAALEEVGVSLPVPQSANGKTETARAEQAGGPLTALLDRGTEYLIRTSPNYQAARALASQQQECVADSDPSMLPTAIRDIALRAASAYLENDPSLKDYEDPDRLRTEAEEPKQRHVESIQACGYWGIGDLAFVQTAASYTSHDGDGKVNALIVLRNRGGEWRMLTGITDPSSNSAFVDELPLLASLISKRSMSRLAPDAPILLTPLQGVLTHAPGVRFADLSWHPSTSEGEVAEIVEFAYNSDARLFTIFFSGRPPETEHFSSGGLMGMRSTWLWRVWSISESGVVSFSSPGSFEY